jgi:hypothetical protein
MRDARPAIARLLGTLLFRPMRKILVPLIPLLLAAGMLRGNGLRRRFCRSGQHRKDSQRRPSACSERGISQAISSAASSTRGSCAKWGHIRVFAALAALVAAATLGFVLWFIPHGGSASG